MSGSMNKEEIEQALGEVYSIARMSVVKVYCWDAEVYEEVTARNQSEVISKVVSKIRGGGGTVNYAYA